MKVEICIGDLISLVDSRDNGIFASPSLQEPLPEFRDRTSHLRVVPVRNKDGEPPVDFSVRSVFKIMRRKIIMYL